MIDAIIFSVRLFTALEWLYNATEQPVYIFFCKILGRKQKYAYLCSAKITIKIHYEKRIICLDGIGYCYCNDEL